MTAKGQRLTRIANSDPMREELAALLHSKLDALKNDLVNKSDYGEICRLQGAAKLVQSLLHELDTSTRR